MSIKQICGTFLSLATQSRFARLFLLLVFHILFLLVKARSKPTTLCNKEKAVQIMFDLDCLWLPLSDSGGKLR